ncbi:MAG: class I SAM-dependent methyltransferase [Lachnospiraceae bacterium]|nr:class I SAM-dependent methyltransferase [Lachnospiraceae bacterium]
MIRKMINEDAHVYIYGAGERGLLCRDYFRKNAVSVDAFIISDSQEKGRISGTDILYLSEISCLNIMVFVAVDSKYWGDIQCAINKRFGIKEQEKFYFITDDDYLYIYRELYPINYTRFLDVSDPAGPLMGCDRGTSISRYYIKKYLDQEWKNATSVYTVYEVGENRYSKQYYPNASHEILDYTKGEDLTDLSTLPKEGFDVFLCTQVFNFIYNVKAAIQGAYYVLRPGGVLLATVAGNISQISKSDMKNYGDYWRFTFLSIKLLVSEVFGEENVSVFPYGNAMSTTAYIQGMCVEDLPHPELLDDVDPEYALVIGVTAKRV